MNGNHYTNIVSLWNELGVRTRDPITKDPSYYKIAFKPTTFQRCLPHNATGKWKTLAGTPLKAIKHNSISEYMEYVKTAASQKREIYGDITPVYQFIAENVKKDCGLEFSNIRTVFIDIEVDSKGGFASVDDPHKPITAITVEVWGQYLVWGCGDYTPKQSNVLYTKCGSEAELITSFAKWWSTDYPDVVTGWNVQFYDIPYIANRIEFLHSKGIISFQSKVLSPWGKLSNRQAVINGQTNTVIDILGISILDYLELYRKFSLTQQESYRLDYIAEVELGENKVSYDEYGSLQELAEKNYEQFIDYNIKDVELVKMLNNKLHHINLCIQIAYSSRVNYTDPFKQVRIWDAIIYYDLYDKQISIPAKADHEKLLDYAGAYVKDPQVGKHAWIASFDVNSLYPSIMREWNISSDRHLPLQWLKDYLRTMESANPTIQAVQPTDCVPINWIDQNPDPKDIPAIKWALTALIDHITHTSVDDMLKDLDMDNPYPWLKVLGVCVSANAQVYRSDSSGFLSIILAKMYQDRKRAKDKETQAKKKIQTATTEIEKKKFENEASTWGLEQNTKKILLNSLYGSIGNNFARWFDIRHAESITLTGQLIIRYVANKVNEFLVSDLGIKRDYVLASDTDSILVTLGPVVSNMAKDTNTLVDIIDKYCEVKLQPIINKAFKDIHEKLNTQESILAMKREAIAEHGVWTAKKRYLLWIHDNEGIRYNPPKLKIVGIEAVRSSTPKFARKIIKQALEHFVKADQDAFYNLLETAETEFNKKPFEDIASPRSVNGLLDYPILTNGGFSNKTPVHVKGSLVYNRIVTAAGLDSKYPLIHNGQKIRFCYLKEENPFKVNVIAAPNKLPTELHIEEFLNRTEQFEKTVLQPLETIIKYAGWSIRKTSTLF